MHWIEIPCGEDRRPKKFYDKDRMDDCHSIHINEFPMKADGYAVCRGDPGFRPLILGVVCDSESAVDLMERMYARIPATYCVVCQKTGETIASLSSGEKDLYDASLANQPVFDIFFGVPDKNAKWCESVEGLSNARSRMEEIAKHRPGAYFLFYRRDHSILARIQFAEPCSISPITLERSA